MRRSLLACGLVALLAPVLGAQSVPSIVVGNDVLIPNWPAPQSIKIQVTGGQQVDGLSLYAEIAGGGTGLGGTLGPTFSSADLITGTIFANNNGGQKDGIALPSQIYSGSVITSGSAPDPTVSANGLLATLSISTAGIGPGIYPLKLNGPKDQTALGINRDYNSIIPNITNGNLVVLYPGDTNEDGIVNLADLLTLTRNFGKSGAGWAMGDTNGDGVVNLADFLNLSRDFGKSISLNPAAPALAAAALASLSAVPEPATLGLLGITALALCRRRRKLI